MKSLILHSDELRSLLDSGQCEVRRRVKHQGSLDFLGAGGDDRNDPANWGWRRDGNGRDEFCALARSPDCDYWAISPFGSPGEVRWVREKLILWPGHAEYAADADGLSWVSESQELYEFLDTYKSATVQANRMPRWASRLTVRVVSVAVERVEGEWWWVGEMEVSK